MSRQTPHSTTNNLPAHVTATSDHVSAFSCMLALLWSPTRQLTTTLSYSRTEYIRSLGINSTLLKPVQTQWQSYAHCHVHNTNLLMVCAYHHSSTAYFIIAVGRLLRQNAKISIEALDRSEKQCAGGSAAKT